MIPKFALTLLALVLALAPSLPAANGPVVLVAGYDSDNVVEFDLATGRWNEIAKFPFHSQPRGITANEAGEIFVGLQGGNRNIAKLVPGEDGLKLQDVTAAIGRFGPGYILHGKDRIWAAGDSDRVIYEINPATGEVTAPPQYKNCCNLVGLAADGQTLYAAEILQRSILRYDLRTPTIVGERIITKSEHLNRPVGMTIGHNGDLYVANGRASTIVEFNPKTGEFVRTLVDLGAGGKEGINGVLYSPEMRRYYLASGSEVYEVDPSGKILASYNSPALRRAHGIALMPARLRATPAAVVAVVAKNSAAGTASDAGVAAPQFSRPVTTLKMSSDRLSITGAPGERYRVLATTDFVTWEPIATLENAAGLVEFVDPDADKFDKRFYRLEPIAAQ
ncbi:MAG: SMP-30/gluconolactonase/LRE family protein [Verrucomicrobia bacterium]|nr:SMP-30/gluconolactonase/LRE family protein [Verrucomicrobiota bacterium]